jgi:hypothetical protein
MASLFIMENVMLFAKIKIEFPAWFALPWIIPFGLYMGPVGVFVGMGAMLFFLVALLVLIGGTKS